MNTFLKYFFLLFLFNTYLFSSEDLKKVKLQLSWLNQFQFAGYYIAKEKGFYKEVGLDVEILPYQMNMDIPSMISNKEVDFAIGRENLILEEVNKNKNLTLLYALFQTSPLVLLTKKSSNINHIKDFLNKRIMSTIEDSSEASLKAMITSERIDFRKLNFINHTHNINDLIDDKVDVISAYTSITPYDLKKKNIEYKIFNPKDYGFDIYSDFLYTNNELIDSDLKTVENFKNASLKAWKYAYSNIEESVDLILKKYNNQNLTKKQLLFEAKELKKLSYYNTSELGKIDESKIQRMYDLYRLMGLLKVNVDLKDFILKNSNSLLLTSKEKEYLKNKKVIKVCSTPSWLPYGKIDNNGFYKGIAAEFISNISNKIPSKIEIIPTIKGKDSLDKIKSKVCDIIPIIVDVEDRNKFMNFTSPYFKQSLVFVTKDKELFIDKLEDIKDKKIAVHNNTAFIEILKNEYPQINLTYVNSAEEGMNKVNDSDVFAYVDALISVAYYIRKNGYYHLKVSGKLEKMVSFSMGTIKDEPLLNNIIEKALNQITFKEVDEILKNWTYLTLSNEVDYKIVFQVILISLVAFLILFIFIYKQNKLKKQIENLNKTLEQRVKDEVESNRIKDVALYNQSKLASMGEMIRNIAHQWRQPLNRVNLSLSVIKKVYNDEDDKELINTKIYYAEKNIKYMSETIDDFMNFFKPDKKQDMFSINESVLESLKLIESRTSGINITVSVPENLEIYNYKNEYIQVLLIILNNALDNFEITNVKSKNIKIMYLETSNYVELFINDNSGGIHKNNLDDIFEPYFTTKFKKEGTGLGLYMAKILIEDSMNGFLSVKSKDENTTFKIRLKK